MGDVDHLRGDRGDPATKPHGYCFEVDPSHQAANHDPSRSRALGRFAHESIVVDPLLGPIYLTEDAGNPNGLLYRWTPPRARAAARARARCKRCAADAGRARGLEGLRRATGAFVPDLSVATEPGTKYRAELGRRFPTATPRRTPVRKQFTTSRSRAAASSRACGGATAARTSSRSFARTADGSAAQHDGQVWFLDPAADTIELKLHFAYTPADQDSDPDGPDNITVSPYGGLILAEDGEGKQPPRRRRRAAARRSSSPATSSPNDSRVHRADVLARSAGRCSRTSRRPATCSRSAARFAAQFAEPRARVKPRARGAPCSRSRRAARRTAAGSRARRPSCRSPTGGCRRTAGGRPSRRSSSG